jgi:ATP-dependent Clp protease, protease subunit
MDKDKNWFSARMVASDPSAAEICIYDEIGIWGIRAKDFIYAVKALNAKTLSVRLNSPGGDIADGVAIYNFLKSEVAKGTIVNVEVDGWAASIASVVMLSGQTVSMGEGTFVMIHNPSWCCFGSSADMRKYADELDKFRDAIIDIYVKETGQPRDTIAQWMDAETWMTAQEAVDNGFADCVSERAKAAACAQPRNMTFRRTPKLAVPNEHIEHKKNMKEIAKLFGLPEDATQEQIVAKIQQERGDSKTALDNVTKDRDTLRSAKDAAENDAAELVVQTAIDAGKIKAAAKYAYVKAYKADPSGAKAMLDGIEAKPTAPAAPKNGHAPLPAPTGKGGPSDAASIEDALSECENPRDRVQLARQYRTARSRTSGTGE